VQLAQGSYNRGVEVLEQIRTAEANSYWSAGKRERPAPG